MEQEEAAGANAGLDPGRCQADCRREGITKSFDSGGATSTIFVPLEPIATETGLMATSGPGEARSWAFLSRLMEGAALAGGEFGRDPGEPAGTNVPRPLTFAG